MNSTPLIDVSLLEEVSAGDISFKKMLLEMIIKELTTEIPRMNQLLQEENWSVIHNISHKLKTTLGYICTEAICGPNRQIELASKQGSELDDAKQNVEYLYEKLPVLTSELENLAASM